MKVTPSETKKINKQGQTINIQGKTMGTNSP